MKTTSLMVLASLLLLQLLATTAHGIRLDRQLHESVSKKEPAGRGSKDGQPLDAMDHSTSRPCASDGNCSGKGKKPVAPHAAPAAAQHQVQTPRRRNNGDEPEATTASHAGRKEEAAAAQTWSSRALPRQPPQQEQRGTYPDVLDIAEMDYSPATRKPPIHN
ncbi:uncharacterized protein [Lolium perenne]|uniref:uncharacterized protein n=1 Tax=Lolium perenne TaxID=4522 RepID=UPI0021EAC16A|nr:uncharacterized protein LOC127330825 [Lolium perenne]